MLSEGFEIIGGKSRTAFRPAIAPSIHGDETHARLLYRRLLVRPYAAVARRGVHEDDGSAGPAGVLPGNALHAWYSEAWSAWSTARTGSANARCGTAKPCGGWTSTAR